MKNNMKKASVNFGKIFYIFSILCRFLSLPKISDYHYLKAIYLFEKREASVVRISVIEQLEEHDILCLPYSYTNDVINVIVTTMTSC